eukprot:scaffold7606_cov152-Skeletonema_menzelii.AAC.5
MVLEQSQSLNNISNAGSWYWNCRKAAGLLGLSFFVGLQLIFFQFQLFGNSATTQDRDTNNVERVGDKEFVRGDNANAEKVFLRAALSEKPVTDKVTDHHYEIMYGQFLMPLHASKPNMKFLEIGLGCDMYYGPGASVALWKKLLPLAELWEAEFDGECVKKSNAEGKLEGINTLTGDQMNVDTLDEWIEKSGGGFDVIIDDGGHQQCQIWTSLQKLWPEVKPGGLYFIEDLQVSRHRAYSGQVSSPLCDISTNVVDKLQEMMNAILHRAVYNDLFKDVKFIFCQRDACVLGKKTAEERQSL